MEGKSDEDKTRRNHCVCQVEDVKQTKCDKEDFKNEWRSGNRLRVAEEKEDVVEEKMDEDDTFVVTEIEVVITTRLRTVV